MTGAQPQDDLKARADELIAYHSHISARMTKERTSLESALIPVSAYIVVACVESYSRYPVLMRAIDERMKAEDIGRSGHQPGLQVNPVYLWSIANFWLLGRKVLTSFGAVPDDAQLAVDVLDFWERAALAYRGDGKRQAWDAGFSVTPYGPEVTGALLAGATPVADDDTRAKIKRFSATLMNYLFLLYFDTRVGTGDSGPYEVPGQPGKTLLVRDFYKLSTSDFWWSDVAADVPYHNLTCALVLDDVRLEVNDWGTSITEPEDYLDRLSAFALFTTDTPAGEPGRELRALSLDEIDGIVAAVRKAQAQHYRNIAAMTRDEKIRCGAYVYFSFLRPFAVAAGIADDLDWDVPKVTKEMGIYDLLAAIEGSNDANEIDLDVDYYSPIGVTPPPMAPPV